ncbi:ribosome silencing factor [Elusimicrobiota bacterium]
MAKVSFLTLAKHAAKIADDKKAIDVSILNVRKLTSVTDYFVIATADSQPQLKAIADTISKAFHDEYTLKPSHKDGNSSDSWLAIDYGGLIVHIMSTEMRNLYTLERIWEKARKTRCN